MTALTSSQRQYLKRLAHHMKPIVQIGKNGLTDQVVGAVETALNAHELIKVKFIDFQDQKDALSQEIAEKLSGERVSTVGNTLILYRRHPEREKRKIALPA